MRWHMAETFAEKFEQALEERRERDPDFGLRTLARKLAKDDPRQTEIIRRRLNKYRPPKGGGSAQVSPTQPTRHEIEDALGLPLDALKPEPQTVAATAEFLRDIAPLRRLWEVAERLERGELVMAETRAPVELDA